MNNYRLQLLRVLSRAVILVLVISLIIPPSTAQAWKSNAHVFLAELARLDALDGTITLPRYDPDTGQFTGEDLGPYPVDPLIQKALQRCSAQYRAGALGPDAYPDMGTGQMLIHPNNQPNGIKAFDGGTNTSQWINAIWQALPLDQTPAAGSDCTEQLARVAFTTGYLTHAAGDMYGHTFINYFAGGAFDFTDNALQHVIIEGYVDKLIPSDETSDFYDISIDKVQNFIYDVLVIQMPGKTIWDKIFQTKANGLSIPRFFNGVRTLPAGILATFDNMDTAYDTWADAAWSAAKACALSDRTCSRAFLTTKALNYESAKKAFDATVFAPRAYFRAWVQDIDDGLLEWVNFNHEVALVNIFAPDAGRPDDVEFPEKVLEYMTLYFEPMSPLPDSIGIFINFLAPLHYGDFVYSILKFGDSIYDYILDYDLYAGITIRKLQQFAMSPASLFDPVVLVGNGPRIFRQQFRSEYLRMGQQTGVEAADAIRNDPVTLALINQARISTGSRKVEYTLQVLERASQLEKMLTPEVLDRLYLENLDYAQIPSMRNTVAMDKLIMISRTGMDQLLQDIGYRCEKNLVPAPIMLGTFMRSLDEGDQGLDPTVPDDRPDMQLGALAPDNRALMGLARDPVAYRTVLQLQEGHSPTVLGYLNQTSTQCTNDPDYQACVSADFNFLAQYSLPSGVEITDIFLDNNKLYVTAGTSGLFILDIPTLLNGVGALRGQLVFREDFYAQNILVTNGVAYISNGQVGLISVDVSNPASPTVIADYARAEPPVFSPYQTDTYGIVKNGNKLYVSAGYNGVLVFDIATSELQEIDQIVPPMRMVENALENPANVIDVDLLDVNTLVVTTASYLMVFDISPEAYSPIMLDFFTFEENARRTTLSSGLVYGLAYVADGSGGLQIFNLPGVRTGIGIEHIGGIDLVGESVDVAVTGSTGVVATTNMLQFVDVTNVSALKLSCPFYEAATISRIWGEHLFTAAGGTIKIFTIPAQVETP
jgi:hypothetical protein